MKNLEDKFFKYYWEKLPKELHYYIGEPGNYKKKYPTEIVTVNNENFIMDQLYERDDGLLNNVESQSSPTYKKELLRFNDYQRHSSINYKKPVNTIILYTGNPNHGLYELWVSETNLLKPKYIIFKEMNGNIKLNNLRYKINNNLSLNCIEAQDLVLIPLMNIDGNIEDIVEELCHLMKKDKSINDDLKFELLKLEVFIINMFVRKEKRKNLFRVIGMNIRLDNLEEDLNNWETEILNKGKIEGKIEGKQEALEEIAKRLKEKISIEEINEITGLSIEKIERL
ncbi:hypothetical protein [Methanobrevibacter sp.]|uniref:hypothetical protein n=1 Tax=Methanobrevibacter sp. TaxID=66852 RepID=UPI003865F6B6